MTSPRHFLLLRRHITPERMWLAGGLTVVAFCAALNLIFPFVSDQVVALFGAKKLAAGGVLYVDFWDNKMPGLFWFYLVAGELFGYSEIGVHKFECLWMTLFAVALIGVVRGLLRAPWLAAVCPIAVIGTYYASVEAFALTQLEIIVALPTFLCCWAIDRALANAARRHQWVFLSGLLAGVVVTFKLVFAPLFVAFWLLASWRLFRDEGGINRIFYQVWAPATLGVAAVLGFVVLKFWFDGGLRQLLWTAFVYPPKTLLREALDAPWHRLVDSIRFFSTYYATWAVFILVAIYRWWRGGRTLFVGMMIVWLAVGFVIILIQQFSWWSYHFLNLFTPAGVLAIKGIDDALEFLRAPDRGQRLGQHLLAILLVAPCVGALAIPVGQKVSAYIVIFAQKQGSIRDFQRSINLDYLHIQHSVRFLSDTTALPGDIYVFGDPLYYFLSGRSPALPVIGWPWEYFLDEQWAMIPDQLAQTKPAYIYIDNNNRRMIDARGGGVDEFIAERYLRLLKDHDGTWYILRPAFRADLKPG